MRQSLIALAVLGTLASYNVMAEEAAAAPAAEAASPWTATANIGFVSDYYFRGISQSWHRPAVQGGFDISHSSGFYGGVWGSNVAPNTYPEAGAEIDLYGGYNGSISAIEGLGWTVGLYSYFYPGGSWEKYPLLTATPGTKGAGVKKGGRWDTTEANLGLSYKWLSAKVSVTLTDWFGAERETGWDGSTKGSTYWELNAAYPLEWYGLTFIGHVGYLNVSGKLSADPAFAGSNANAFGIIEDSPDYTDWKIGLSKSFTIGKSEGWNAGLYYVGSDGSKYWSDKGYGGSSFNTDVEAKNLYDDRFVVTVGRTF